MITVYGVVDKYGTHTDISNTLHGAKCYATRNGYTTVSKRVGYNTRTIAEKVNGKWKSLN